MESAARVVVVVSDPEPLKTCNMYASIVCSLQEIKNCEILEMHDFFL